MLWRFFILVVGFLCMLAGLAGSVLPGVARSAVDVYRMLVLQVSDRVQFSTPRCRGIGPVVISLVLDYIAPIIGPNITVEGNGASGGVLSGTILGLFVFPPWGLNFGPVGRGHVGELLQGKDSNAAIKGGGGGAAIRCFYRFFFRD